MNIPFSPPHIDQRAIDAVVEVLQSGWITTGPKTKLFETELAAYIGVDKVIALNSWTNACELVLRWYGVGAGDEVIVPAYTYCASANIILHVGATPILVDVLDDFTMDPEALKQAITERTKCIIPVDIGGLPVRIDEIMDIARAAGADFNASTAEQEKLARPLVLLDAAHSFGATYKGEKVGTQADISGYSFHAVKNLTTAEGGALAFNLSAHFDTAALYRWFNTMSLHGQSKDALAKTQAGAWRYDVAEPGYKCNMTDMQAAIGLVELARYDTETLPKRKSLFEAYAERLKAFDWAVIPRSNDDERSSSYHLFMLRLKDFSEDHRDQLITYCAEQGVSVNVHFQPLPLLTAYKERGYRISDHPKAFELYANEITLPLFYDLTMEQLARVVEVVSEGVDAIQAS